MSLPVPTPITQALSEGVLTRRELKRLMIRSDRPGLIRLVLWLGVLALTSYLVWISQNSWAFFPAMFLHGVVLVHHFSLQHECCHYTAFKTRWLNDVVGNVCGLVIILPNRFFRYEHCDHHTFTQIKGKDTELIELPQSFAGYFYYLSSIPYWKAKLSELFRHAFGSLNTAEKRFIPRDEHRIIVLEARYMLIFYVSLIVASIVWQNAIALWFWFIPLILGEPVMRAIRMTEHVGRPTVADMRVNTRSNHIGFPMRFLCWNMNYHAEHHYASSVPFHALPKLSEKLDGYMHNEKQGYYGAHKAIVAQLSGRAERCDR